MELIKALLLVIAITCVLVVGLCLLSGRRGHGLNGHYEMPTEEELASLRAYNVQDVPLTQALYGGAELDEELDAVEFFETVEGYRRDFA